MSVSDTSKIKVIGVAGGSASGKTTIVNIIREHFGDNPIYSYNIYTSPFHAEDLMLQWPHVKRLIEEEFQKRESKRAALDAFEV